MSSKSMSQIFQTIFQTKDIIFALCGVFFSRVQLKRYFSDKKNSSEIWDTSVEKLSTINMAKY